MFRAHPALSRAGIGFNHCDSRGFLDWRATMGRILASISLVLAVWLIGPSPSSALAQDYRIVSYQNTVEGLVTNWAAAVIPLQGKLISVLKELEEKKATQNPTDADKARIEELRKQRDDLGARIESENDNLRVALMIVEVQPGAPEREFVVLPDWLKGIIKAKGVPVGHGITLVPDASFDLKALKLKSFNVGLRFDWG
jgi:hypothetical protein